MRILILSLTLLLTSCATSVPVKPKFPEVPQIIKERCENLKKI